VRPRACRGRQVDGVRNPKVQSIFFEDMPIHQAAFASGGSHVRARAPPRAGWGQGCGLPARAQRGRLPHEKTCVCGTGHGRHWMRGVQSV